MKRHWIAGAAALLISAPLAAQTAKMPRIGWLAPDRVFPGPGALEELRRIGWVDGKNVAIDYRYADGSTAKLPELAADLVRQKVDVIITFSAGVLAAKRATEGSTIPVVMATSADPVRIGVASSLARPGGNVTGITYLTDQLAGKRLQYVKEAIPSLKRVAVIWEPAHLDNEMKGIQAASALLGVQVQSVEVPRPARPNEVELAVRAAVHGKAEAIILAPGGFTISQRKELISEAAKHRLPAFSAWSIFAEDGAVLTYGPNPVEMSRRLAYYVDRILKGAKPDSMPIEQPSQFELVVNLNAAKALGMAFPPRLAQRAEWVIE
ncbi:MAG TPA: ABC transporter substrate-binding protein [Burkholderiales bacterium]|nr:ABC transporter substrate-binding protein [Burkholderiales bacterium]